MAGDNMIKNIKLFVNKNDKSIKFARLVRKKLSAKDFIVAEDDNHPDDGIREERHRLA